MLSEESEKKGDEQSVYDTRYLNIEVGETI